VDVVAVNDNGQISPRNLPQKSVITLKKSGEGNSSNSSTTLVIGIVVGVVGTIIFVFIFLYCYHKRKKGRHHNVILALQHYFCAIIYPMQAK
jgi:beta-lactamase regulating signal transducer with metallopeptidase domain